MIQSMLADMYTEIECMRALTYQVGREIVDLPEGEGGRGVIHKRSAAALLAAGRGCMRVLDQAVQIHGGMGFMRETAVERMARDARVQSIGGGASEVMLEEIAKRFGQVLSD